MPCSSRVVSIKPALLADTLRNPAAVAERCVWMRQGSNTDPEDGACLARRLEGCFNEASATCGYLARPCGRGGALRVSETILAACKCIADGSIAAQHPP